ncbi:MAG TPA: acyltransferase family protein [Acidimicrobiia bacterium]
MKGDTRFSYRPGLDGLRALAVAAVFAYHLDAGWVRGGFLGVDTFFVLSGFLITTLILVEWRGSGTLSLAAFWARRARRLLPALILVLFAVAAYAAWQAKPEQLDSLRGDMFSTLFYGANWRFINSGQSYFSLFSDASPLRHAWSLAIEEQFYLVWPLITFVCLRLARGRHFLLGAVCIGGAIASAVTMARLYESADPSRAYYGTDGRAQLLLIGALLAIVLVRYRPHRPVAIVTTHVLGLVGAWYVLWAFFQVGDTDAWMYRGGYALFAIAVAAVIASVVQPQHTLLQRVFSQAPIVWLGRISYGVYLWHWPVIVVLSPERTGIDGAALTLLRVALTLGLSTASYYLVELPIRERRFFRRRLALALSPVAFVATGLVIIMATLGAAPLPAYYRSGPTRVIKHSKQAPPTTSAGPITPAAVAPTAPARPPRVLLVGDSVATSLYAGLDEVGSRAGMETSLAAWSGCGVIRGIPALDDGRPMGLGEACERSIPKLQESMLSQVQPDLVVWLSNWEMTDHIVNGLWLRLGTPDGDAGTSNLLAETADRLQSTGARLVILLPAVPTPEGDYPMYPYSARLQRIQILNQLLQAQAMRHPDTTNSVDLMPIVCPGGPPCVDTVNGIRLRPDGSHFEADGARYVSEQLVPRLLSLWRTPTSPTPPAPAPAAQQAAAPKHGK